jgi:hypothetical protein
MSKVEEAKKILKALGIPPAQQNEISALTLLALCGLKRKDSWANASRSSLTVTKGIMAFIAEHYQKIYAPNTRETFRRQVLHQFVQARIVDYNPDEPDLPTNSPRAHYSLSSAALNAIRTFGTTRWKIASKHFVSRHGALLEIYRKERAARLSPCTITGWSYFVIIARQAQQSTGRRCQAICSSFCSGSQATLFGRYCEKKFI